MHWRRKWQPTPVFLSGESHGQRSLVGCSPRVAQSRMLGARAPPMTKVMRKEARHTQRWDRASEVPLEILKHLPPKPASAYFLLCALTYTSDFTGGCPPLPLSEKRVSLQLQLIILGCDSVSTYKLLWKSSSLPEWVFPATCDCSEPPNCERHEIF